jgi:hypothetical protein
MRMILFGKTKKTKYAAETPLSVIVVVKASNVATLNSLMVSNGIEEAKTKFLKINIQKL